MNHFQFFSATRIVFGCGEIQQLGELSGGLGRVAFVIHSSSAPVDRLFAVLSASGVRAVSRRQTGEPTVADVESSVLQCRADKCDHIIGFGGGSAIDTAKATAGLITNGGTAIDYMEIIGAGKKLTRPALPWIAVPTTAGTGAEVTRNAVITLPEQKYKASIRSELLLPRLALVDPELGVSVPPDVTAYSGMDALCQLIESYTSIGANELTDALAAIGIPKAAGALPRVFHDGTSVTDREAMALAALLSGITLTNAGLGAVHGFAGPLGANFSIPHGLICAALLPLVIRANITALRQIGNASSQKALAKYASIGRMLCCSSHSSNDEAIDFCGAFLTDLVSALCIPGLSKFGLKTEHVAEQVKLAKNSSSMRFNPVLLSDDVLSAVLQKAMGTVEKCDTP